MYLFFAGINCLAALIQIALLMGMEMGEPSLCGVLSNAAVMIWFIWQGNQRG